MDDKILVRLFGNRYNTHDVNAAYFEKDEIWSEGNVYRCIKDVAENTNIELANTTYWTNFLSIQPSSKRYTEHSTDSAYYKGDTIWSTETIHECIRDVPVSGSIALTNTTYWKVIYTAPSFEIPATLSAHDVNAEYKKDTQIWVAGSGYVAIVDIAANSNVALTDETKWRKFVDTTVSTAFLERKHELTFRTVDPVIVDLAERLITAAPAKVPHSIGAIKICPPLNKKYIAIGNASVADWVEF